MNRHVLDNPAWNAMISGSEHLASGNEHVKFFFEEVGPFAGLKEYNEPLFRELFDLLPPNRTVVIPTVKDVEIAPYWKVIDTVKALQMIFEEPAVVGAIDAGIVPLKDEHIPEMIALTQLTKPGPFLKQTIEFGNYKGIFNSGKLVAMAGQRMHPLEYVEISAVCTHPDYTGNGYAQSLINDQVLKIIREGNIPFLHVTARNINAIRLYKRLGFTVRAEMNIYVLQKEV
jgi:ribosomal protein S18 acetylase RimI-like enzyme